MVKEYTLNIVPKIDWSTRFIYHLPNTPAVWKLDGSQWKADENHPKLVEGYMGMYHWEV